MKIYSSIDQWTKGFWSCISLLILSSIIAIMLFSFFYIFYINLLLYIMPVTLYSIISSIFRPLFNWHKIKVESRIRCSLMAAVSELDSDIFYITCSSIYRILSTVSEIFNDKSYAWSPFKLHPSLMFWLLAFSLLEIYGGEIVR